MLESVLNFISEEVLTGNLASGLQVKVVLGNASMIHASDLDSLHQRPMNKSHVVQSVKLTNHGRKFTHFSLSLKLSDKGNGLMRSRHLPKCSRSVISREFKRLNPSSGESFKN